jgi:hypothetical protein
MAAVYRGAEEERVANFQRLKLDAPLHDGPICAGQTVWTLFLDPVTAANAVNHPGYVVLAGVVQDTRETTFEVAIGGRVETFARLGLYAHREEAEREAAIRNAAISRRLSELHDGNLA